jgi:hypothetical protein
LPYPAHHQQTHEVSSIVVFFVCGAVLDCDGVFFFTYSASASPCNSRAIPAHDPPPLPPSHPSPTDPLPLPPSSIFVPTPQPNKNKNTKKPKTKKHNSELLGKEVYIKLDALQPSGSFKLRGIGYTCQKVISDGGTQLVSSSVGGGAVQVMNTVDTHSFWKPHGLVSSTLEAMK